MAMTRSGRSARMEKGFDRIAAEWGVPTTTTETFSAAGAYDKLGMLVLLALVAGAVGYASDSGGLALLGLVGGMVCWIVGIFRPSASKVVAPLYAIFEGLCLGAITAALATGTSGVAPLAIIFTAGVFFGAFVMFRTGLVKVTPKFVTYTIMAGVGFLVALIAGMLGLFPGLSSQTGLLVFGLIGIAIGVAYLFIDFNYVQVAEQRRLPAEGEWFAAFLVMTSLVFVYINVLRVVAARRR